jgi:pilus assembly protein TadC
MVSALAAAAGALTAASLITTLHTLRPPPLRLDVALARIQPTPPTVQRPPAPTPGERLGAWLTGHLDRPGRLVAVPHTDLALLHRSAEQIMLAKLALAVLGLAVPSTVFTALAVAGVSPPWTLPTITGVLLALALFFAPDLVLRSVARRRRRDFHFALTCYLQLVVLERYAGASVAAALEQPARTADTWPFARISDALTRARHAQQPPWQALADLAEHIGVHDLMDLAYTAEIANQHGARMHDVLTAKITAMHHQAAATARSQANARTTTMWVPTSLLMLGFVILIGFPFLARLVTST